MAGKKGNASKSEGSLYRSVLLLTPLVVFIFSAGVLVGSSSMHAHPGGHMDASRPDPAMAQRLLVELGQERGMSGSSVLRAHLDSSSVMHNALDHARVSTTSASLDSLRLAGSSGPGVSSGSSRSDAAVPMLRGGASTTATGAAAPSTSEQGVAAVSIAAPVAAASTGGAVAVALRPGWAQYFDPNTNMPYWHHPASGITTWDNPNLPPSSSVGSGGGASTSSLRSGFRPAGATNALAKGATSTLGGSGSADASTAHMATTVQQSRSPLEARPSLSVAAGGGSWATLGSPMDGVEVTLSLWVYLDSKAAAEKNMLTLLSNKGTGCAVNGGSTNGFALYVNEWETSDHQLLLEYGGPESGCYKLKSSQTSTTMSFGRWSHVIASLTPQRADLFLDGTLVASTTAITAAAADGDGEGVVGKGATVRLPPPSGRAPQSTTSLHVGRYPDGSFPLKHANVSSLLVLSKGLSSLYEAPDAGPSTSLSNSVRSLADFTSWPERTAASASATQMALTQALPSVSTDVVRAYYPLVEPSKWIAGKSVAAAQLKCHDMWSSSNIAGGGSGTSSCDYHRADGGSGGGAFSGIGGGGAGQVLAGHRFALGKGVSTSGVTATERAESDVLGRQNAQRVVNAMKHAWKGYKQHAWGHDELKPISGRSSDNWGGIGCTLVDALDTLWYMGLKDEFNEAKRWVASSLTFSRTGSVSVFETTIRELGGLLAAFDCSGDPMFVEKAADLGNRLLHAFETPSGIPYGSVSLNGRGGSGHNAAWTGNSAVLSELGTLQVDFRYLSEMTGDPKYAKAVNRVFDLMAHKKPPHGLFPIYVNTRDGSFTNSKVTFGALGDSFYEYLLKVFVQGGMQEDYLRQAYDRAMDGMAEKLLHASNPSKLAYIADWENGRVTHKMDHLVCFMGGLLALGAATSPGGAEGSARAKRDFELGRAVTHTCYQMYERSATGVAAEWYVFREGRDLSPGPGGSFNILRPETIESIFVLHQLTGDPVYRQWGARMFDALEKHCRTPIAYGGLRDVNRASGQPEDRMESFFLAETLKYHYLLQAPLEDHGVDVVKGHVFNTEAHPLSIFGTPRFNELKNAMAARRAGSR